MHICALILRRKDKEDAEEDAEEDAGNHGSRKVLSSQGFMTGRALGPSLHDISLFLCMYANVCPDIKGY